MDILVGLFALALGAIVCFSGLRIFLVTLPLWGFIAGFFVGAAGVHAIFGDGFLSTLTGWIIGFFVALLFAALSYLYWYLGVIIASASAGGLIGSGFAAAIGIDSNWLVFFFALIGAVLVAFLAMAIALPVYLVVFNTAFLGATALVAGVMLILNRIDREELGFGAAWAMIQESWFWILVWVVVAALGIGSQLRWINTIALPSEKWVRADTTAVQVA